MLHEASTKALVPAHAEDVDAVRLGGIDSHVEGDGLTLVDAGSRGVALDLTYGR